MNTHDAVERVAAKAFISSGEARRTREAAGLSLAECADVLDTSPTAISRWETGSRVPSGPSAVAYKRLLDAVARAL